MLTTTVPAALDVSAADAAGYTGGFLIVDSAHQERAADAAIDLADNPRSGEWALCGYAKTGVGLPERP